jgi:large subunit ribosomal protein L18
VERKEKDLARKRRKKRVSARVRGTAERPRLVVFRSARHIFAQIIDDRRHHTLVCASTLNPELKGGKPGSGKVEAAKKVGRLVAEKALAQSIQKVVFDRNGFLYHGRIKALADGAREKGLDF